jgi:chromosome segregation ATPase
LLKKDYAQPRITKVGSVENQQQKEAREQFMSAEEIARQKATLAKNREARLEALTQLGEEAKESLEETNKKLAQQTEKLAKIKEDLENIAKMKEAGPNWSQD